MSFICMELDATSLYVLRRHWSLPEIYGDSPVANKASEEYFNRMITAADKLKNPKQKISTRNRFQWCRYFDDNNIKMGNRLQPENTKRLHGIFGPYG